MNCQRYTNNTSFGHGTITVEPGSKGRMQWAWHVNAQPEWAVSDQVLIEGAEGAHLAARGLRAEVADDGNQL